MTVPVATAPFDVIIPARYGSTRLPGKALADIAGTPLVCHTVDCARRSDAQSVTVATDDVRIKDVVEDYGAACVMTRSDHPSGTDRLAEAVQTLGLVESSIIVNLQGDEPEMPASLINAVAHALGNDPDAAIATAATAINDWSQFVDPACVKVLVNDSGRAIYFSRAPVPWPRDSAQAQQLPEGCLRHVGLYAYRVSYLSAYSTREVTRLEQTEQLEQLRALHYGELIRVIETDDIPPVGVDTAHDLEQARQRLSS